MQSCAALSAQALYNSVKELHDSHFQNKTNIFIINILQIKIKTISGGNG
jgi:hypothetical protein